LPSDWKGESEFVAHGETFAVEVAKTPYGVFGRSPLLWHDARGDTEADMLHHLAETAEPLFKRQFTISETLGLAGRFQGTIVSLPPESLLKLLYCKDRDVANDARIQIETRASQGLYGPALIEILNDRRHPDRRGAQWCVLDLFEDISSFCRTEELKSQAVDAMKNLLWDAEDDYARTVYKAGVVLGGHLPEEIGGQVLLECLNAPSKIGRRAAIHGLFHVVEWYPEFRMTAITALRELAKREAEPLLSEYAKGMAEDIEAANFDHVSEPVFADED
jgi:hypothetical protein